MKKLLLLSILIIFFISLVGCSEEARLEREHKQVLEEIKIDAIMKDLNVDNYTIVNWEKWTDNGYNLTIILNDYKKVILVATLKNNHWEAGPICDQLGPKGKLYWIQSDMRKFFVLYDWKTDEIIIFY